MCNKVSWVCENFKGPMAIMVQIGLSNRYFIILLIGDNVVVLIIYLIRQCNFFFKNVKVHVINVIK